jgi:hypothetical protein
MFPEKDDNRPYRHLPVVQRMNTQSDVCIFSNFYNKFTKKKQLAS